MYSITHHLSDTSSSHSYNDIPLQFLLVLTTTAVMARPSFHEGHGFEPDEPKLISQSVHLHEVPTKVIKVTKTVAIKVPVPYPVKVSNLSEKMKVESQLTIEIVLIIFMNVLITIIYTNRQQ